MGFECGSESEAGRKIRCISSGKIVGKEEKNESGAKRDKMKKEHCTGIVLAGGKGSRMGSKIHKQYLLLAGKPVLYYSLKIFQETEFIDEIILVVGEGEKEFCRQQFVKEYGINKITKIVVGGAERYHSVWNGLMAMENENGYVFIHDGARPFLEKDILERAFCDVKRYHACVVGMPIKDTVKIANEQGMVSHTPQRSKVWTIQTPQVFETELIKRAYHAYMEEKESKGIRVTDDASVVELMTDHAVKLVEGSYANIKITTPEDLKIGESLIR